MNPPTDLTLPFFAYGLFRPGQIAYFQIREYVQEAIAGVEVKGQLRIRDGLPMIDADGTGDRRRCSRNSGSIVQVASLLTDRPFSVRSHLFGLSILIPKKLRACLHRITTTTRAPKSRAP
jgi:hypothetical protein